MVQAVLPQVDRSVSGVRNTPSMSVQAGRPRAVERNVGQRITIAGSVLVLPEVAYYGVPVILDVPGLGFVDVPEEEYARLYERLASSDPEQIEAAMVSLRAIKGAEDLEIEAAQRRPALSSDDTYLVERDLSERLINHQVLAVAQADLWVFIDALMRASARSRLRPGRAHLGYPPEGNGVLSPSLRSDSARRGRVRAAAPPRMEPGSALRKSFGTSACASQAA
jgi:hypothetical protein